MSIKENSFRIALDGETLINHSQPTVDGRYVTGNESGTYQTPIGEVTVSLGKRHDYGINYFVGPVVIYGERLRRTPRPFTRDLERHRAATGGIHTIVVGHEKRGATHIGKDPQTGKIRTLEVR